MAEHSGMMPRLYGHSAVVYDDSMWVWGGKEEDSYSNSLYAFHFGATVSLRALTLFSSGIDADANAQKHVPGGIRRAMARHR